MAAPDPAFVRQIEHLCPGRVEQYVDLSVASWWKIGGRARCIVAPSSTAELRAVRRAAHDAGVASLILGEASNLLISDAGIDALCIRLGHNFSRRERQGQRVSIEAGAWVPGVARWFQHLGLSGLEHTCGIPGSLGGLVMMNGGSLRRSIGTNVESVTSVTASGDLLERQGEECEFAYRDSLFSRSDEAIAVVRLAGEEGDPAEMRQAMIEIMRARRLKFPRKWPNCGSVFKSNPAHYAVWGPPGAMVERAGWKGVRRGAAEVSALHGNFIINRGGARAVDVLGLIGDIQRSVKELTGYLMEPEVRYVCSDGSILQADAAYRRLLAGDATL